MFEVIQITMLEKVEKLVTSVTQISLDMKVTMERRLIIEERKLRIYGFSPLNN